LYGFTIVLPPLRERREDVPLLAEHFLQRNAREDRVPRTTLTPAAAAVLKEQDWPGNLHELRHTIAMSMLAAQGSPIEPRHLHLEDGTQPGPNLGPGMRPTLGAAVRQRTAQVLDHTRGALPGPHRAVPSRQAGPSALRDRTREPDLPPPRRQAIQAQVTAVLADTARSPGSSARTSSLWPEARGPRPRHDVRPVPGATGR
jgi:DNA-binding NtrC family response regulator